MIKTFKGLLTVGVLETIALHTNDGKTGYMIRKLQVIQKSPGTVDCEAIVKIWNTTPTTTEITAATIDISQQKILGVAYYSADAESNYYPEDTTIIMDREIFNQDIYITYASGTLPGSPNDPINYYLELEQLSLDLNESTVATLQSIRNVRA